ncbi:MAG: hypothetical protein IKH34_06150 [Oscillospiraceae bacterium]|nr:hypothetical protein [Oscillospiraceae bacterium]
MIKQKRNTWLFIGFLLLAGIANLISRLPGSETSTLMTCVNYLTYIGLLLFWIEAVRTRLLPTAARTSILSAAFLMLLHMLLRIFKYRFAVSVVALRYAVCAYWIPQMLIPALFLMTCIRIRRGGQEKRRWNEDLLLIPAGFLALLAMTNDMHSLVYVPQIPRSEFILNTGTYRYGPAFWIMNAWMIGATVSGLFLLYRFSGRMPKKALRLITGIAGLWGGLILLNLLVLDRLPGGFHMYNNPEIHIFCMLGVFEICIRYRLIPYNENYSAFFRKLQIPSVITDRAFRPVYCTDATFSVEPELLKTASKEPVSLTPDQKLCGKAIRAGYAFWVQEESAVHRAQERLLEANEMIEQENDLIRAETEQKEQDAYLQSRHRIYHEIAEELYPCQKKITQILNEAVPGAEDFKQKIAFVSVLNAYVKRKTNLLLLAAENETLSKNELFLALQESANYLSLAGLQTTVAKTEAKQMPPAVLLSLYDAFEALAEQVRGRAPSLMVSWYGDGLRLAAEAENEPDTSKILLPVRFRRSEDVLYIDILSGKGGEPA